MREMVPTGYFSHSMSTTAAQRRQSHAPFEMSRFCSSDMSASPRGPWSLAATSCAAIPKSTIATATDKRVLVVLHLTGSHGPAYNTRYPKSFERYKPVCESVQLQQCSREQLINAYDNSIRYTDHVVGQAIDLLKMVNADSTLFYLADHGESLGESNLYLHGTPWVLAPDEQKRIPFVVWDSKVATRGAAAARVFDGDFGQANVFHSVLGALDISGPAYKAELDVLAKVRLP